METMCFMCNCLMPSAFYLGKAYLWHQQLLINNPQTKGASEAADGQIQFIKIEFVILYCPPFIKGMGKGNANGC